MFLGCVLIELLLYFYDLLLSYYELLLSYYVNYFDIFE